MKIVFALVLFVLIIFIGSQIYAFLRQSAALSGEYERIKSQVEGAALDYERLKAELEYFLRPENLEKELRARFNYRTPDEKLIIIVPSSSSPSSTP